MKKFLITLLILIALAGTGFFLGWANFAVPPGSYGVISSKSHGIDPEIVQAGKFRWVWYRLIPTNVTISIFRPEIKQFPINFESTLPSADIYAQFVGLGNIDFSWQLRGNISFSVNPDSLVELVQSQKLENQEDLDSYMEETANNVQTIILDFLSSPETDSDRIERLLSGSSDTDLENRIIRQFPTITDFSFTIQTSKFPDFLLYRQIRLIYDEFLAKQREVITQSFGQRAEALIESRLHFSELEQYGELLTRFPILLEYMALRENTAPN